MTEKQKNRVFEIANKITAALNAGYRVTDEKGHAVLGLRYNAKLNPDTWCYLYDGKTGHMVHGGIKYKPPKAMSYSSKFLVHKPGKKPILIG